MTRTPINDFAFDVGGTLFLVIDPAFTPPRRHHRRPIYRIADAAAGDARLAIGILRTAASKADRENYERITDDILLDAATDARAQIKQKSLDALTPHQRTVYEIVRDHGPLDPSEIHDHYTDEVADLRTKRTIRTHLSKMAQYNLPKAEGTSRDREARKMVARPVRSSIYPAEYSP